MKFKPGESGNPKGRKPGSGHRQQLFNDLVTPHKNELVEKAMKLALCGNETMLRLFLERLLPTKPCDEPIILKIPEIKKTSAEAMLALGEEILSAVSNGEVTPEQGKSIMAIIDSQRKTLETTELTLRLAEIERTLKQRKKEK